MLGIAVILFFLAQVVGLVIIPLGLPGTFVQVAAALVLTLLSGGQLLGWTWVLVFLGFAAVGEAIEFFAGRWGARKFGGSRRAGWGALIGGLVGAFVGMPVPIIGSIIASFLGTFLGAWAGQVSEQRQQSAAVHVGIGAVIGRAIGVTFKVFLGLLIIIISVADLIAQAFH
jgi:uncharacterized protein